MSEFTITKRIVAAGCLTALGLTSLTGCASAKGGKEGGSSTQNSDTAPKLDAGITRTVTYYDDGSRLIVIKGQATGAGSRGYDALPQDIYEFCDGSNLTEETLSNDFYDFSGGGLATVANFPGCSDGRLTPSDFSLGN